MFLAEEDLTLHITRGDAGEITVRAIDETTDGGETPYIFKAGEVLRFKVYEKKNCSVVVLQKDYPVVKDAETVTLALEEADTKIGDTISKPVDYWYEIELNPFTEPQTIVGYDEDGAKILRLYPEGQDTEVIPPTPEELGTVDKELDMTSERAIQNQAVARAIVQLESTVEKNNETSTADIEKANNEIAVLKARVNTLATLPEGSTTGDAELIDARVGYDGTTYPSVGEAIRGQFSEIANNIVKSTNIFNKALPVEQGYYDKNGVFKASTVNYTVSIVNHGYTQITASHIGQYYSFWDINNEGIFFSQPLGANLTTDYTIEGITTDVHIIKLTINASLIDELIVVSGTELPDAYTPYGYRELYNLDIHELKEKTTALENKASLVNKKIMFFGDSITDSNYSMYVSHLLNDTGMINVGNFAVSGSKLCHLYSGVSTLTGDTIARKSVPNQVKKLIDSYTDYDTPDIVIVFAGTNDNVETAQLNETQYTVELDSCDLTTFSGAMRWSYEKIIGIYPNATVIFVTPLQSAKENRGYDVVKARRNGIIENCERMSLEYIDAFAKSGIYNGFESDGANGKYLSDGLHPNAVGGVKLAKFIQNELMKMTYKL